MSRTHLIGLLLLLSALAPSTQAHHSFAAEFDYDKTGSIDGIVVEVLFVNPHARYFVSVTGEDGEEIIWDTQTMSTSSLTRFGWTKDTIRVGEHVTMQGNLGKGDTHKLWIREVTREDGSVVRPVAGGAEP